MSGGEALARVQVADQAGDAVGVGGKGKASWLPRQTSLGATALRRSILGYAAPVVVGWGGEERGRGGLGATALQVPAFRYSGGGGSGGGVASVLRIQ